MNVFATLLCIVEHWPIIRETAFQNTVMDTLYGAVLCVVILRLIDTGRRFYNLLIAETVARGGTRPILEFL